MQQSPAFSSFRTLMDKWDNFVHEESKKQEKQDKIKNIIDGSDYMLFFKKGNKVFGTPEDGRIVYASLKNPTDEEMPDGWENDANFAAFDLMSVLGGNPIETLFTHKDIPAIKVIDRYEVAKMLMQCPDSSQVPVVADKNPVGIIDLKDKVK